MPMPQFVHVAQPCSLALAVVNMPLLDVGLVCGDKRADLAQPMCFGQHRMLLWHRDRHVVLAGMNAPAGSQTSARAPRDERKKATAKMQQRERISHHENRPTPAALSGSVAWVLQTFLQKIWAQQIIYPSTSCTRSAGRQMRAWVGVTTTGRCSRMGCWAMKSRSSSSVHLGLPRSSSA